MSRRCNSTPMVAGATLCPPVAENAAIGGLTPARQRGAGTMALTDDAIERIRELIRSGQLPPGSQLPPEQKLADQLGLSRNSMREAVKALQLVRVLDARPGDGTYVTSLAPHLLLENFGFAIDL